MVSTTNTPEQNTLSTAIDRLSKTTGLVAVTKPGRGRQGPLLVLSMPGGKSRSEFVVHVSSSAGDAVAAQLAMEGDPHVLVTRHVKPDQAERYRARGVLFIDCAGNAHIRTADLYVFVKGNKPEPRPRSQGPRLLKSGGLQVMFALLSDPSLVTAPYRAIAQKAGVALGTVAGTFGDLQSAGYILDLGAKGRRLVQRGTLLKLWLTGYEQQLRPKLLVNRYHSEQPGWWLAADLEGALLGGEVAAQKMVGFLKPELVTLFARKLPEQLMLRHRLRLDPGGEVEVLVPFWGFDYPERLEGLAPPLLVYADLLLSGDGRATETAGIVYERYLARHFAED
jgi:hypothetical protein